ncbi:hypothetical protein FLLO111716_10900 [Flavobacterium longum]|uniref:hypothetical protein n=1 Tax=Flavobacterium longum TaxID=1299340 RepID=UPI0039E8898B
MEAQEIVQKLKATPYKFTLASRIRDEVKKLNDDESDFLLLELRRELHKSENATIKRPLQEILR